VAQPGGNGWRFSEQRLVFDREAPKLPKSVSGGGTSVTVGWRSPEAVWDKFAVDSSLEGGGFEIPVPREWTAVLGLRRSWGRAILGAGRIIRTVVGLGKPIERLPRLVAAPLTPNEGAHAFGAGEVSRN
jgi:hypothetical protein